MSSDDRLMTYLELAEALGRSEVAIRSLVARRRWRRVRGNDGVIRLEVPAETLERLRQRSIERRQSINDAPTDTLTTPPIEDRSVVALLQARVAELQEELRETRATAAGLMTKAARVEGLEVLVDELRLSRDITQELLQTTRDQLRQALAALPAPAERRRGWWPWRRSA